MEFPNISEKSKQFCGKFYVLDFHHMWQIQYKNPMHTGLWFHEFLFYMADCYKPVCIGFASRVVKIQYTNFVINYVTWRQPTTTLALVLAAHKLWYQVGMHCILQAGKLIKWISINYIVMDNAHESRVMHCTQYSWREVLHPILPEGRRPEGCIGCNTSRQLYWVQCITSDECALSNTSSAILAAMSLLAELGIHNQKRCYIQYLPRDVLTSIPPTGCIGFQYTVEKKIVKLWFKNEDFKIY